MKDDLIPDKDALKMAGLDDPATLIRLLTFASSHIMSPLSGFYNNECVQ